MLDAPEALWVRVVEAVDVVAVPWDLGPCRPALDEHIPELFGVGALAGGADADADDGDGLLLLLLFLCGHLDEGWLADVECDGIGTPKTKKGVIRILSGS